jgi:RNA recognition motif-containing protein
MGKKIYVGNLSFNVDDEALASLFAQHGNVESAKIVIDRDSGRSKGFGFVEMTSESDAEKAISALNGREQFGRTLNVSEAKPMAPRNGGDSRGFRSGRY